MTQAVGSVELLGRICTSESRPGGEIATSFRVDCAEGHAGRWAWWPASEVPRFWRLIVPRPVLVACGMDPVAGRYVRVIGTMRQDDTDQIDVTRIIPQRSPAKGVSA